jgi:hypothetical protein
VNIPRHLFSSAALGLLMAFLALPLAGSGGLCLPSDSEPCAAIAPACCEQHACCVQESEREQKPQSPLAGSSNRVAHEWAAAIAAAQLSFSYVFHPTSPRSFPLTERTVRTSVSPLVISGILLI